MLVEVVGVNLCSSSIVVENFLPLGFRMSLLDRVGSMESVCFLRIIDDGVYDMLDVMCSLEKINVDDIQRLHV